MKSVIYSLIQLLLHPVSYKYNIFNLYYSIANIPTPHFILTLYTTNSKSVNTINNSLSHLLLILLTIKYTSTLIINNTHPNLSFYYHYYNCWWFSLPPQLNLIILLIFLLRLHKYKTLFNYRKSCKCNNLFVEAAFNNYNNSSVTKPIAYCFKTYPSFSMSNSIT